MKIGIDLGGSHIAVGLIEDGKMLTKKEIDITLDNREDIENFIVTTIVKFVNKILEDRKINIQDIETIGIAAPRNC